MAISGGKYATETALGRVFIGNTAAAGVACPVETGTAVTFGLWNTSVNKYAIPLWFSASFVSGTITIAGFTIVNQNCGYAIGSSAPLSAFTAATPKNALLGYGGASAMQFTGSTATLTAGGTRVYHLGFGQETSTAQVGVAVRQHDFDGRIIVPPGQLIFVGNTIVTTALYNLSMAWAEVPIPGA